MKTLQAKTWRVLVVDDTASVHRSYRKILVSDRQQIESTVSKFQYEIDSAFKGERALKMVHRAIAENRPYSTVFIDSKMLDGWDGFETAKRICQVAADLPIVISTKDSECTWEEFAEKLVGIDQFLILRKPFAPMELTQVAAAQVSRWHSNRLSSQTLKTLESIIDKRGREITSTQDVVFSSLAKLAESRDKDTGTHLGNIEHYTRLLLEQLGETGPYRDLLTTQSIDVIARSSVLHDIGKVGIPDRILLKPGKLTPDEFDVMKTHTTIGADIIDEAVAPLSGANFLAAASEIARFHHEKFDGTGYPEGRAGHDIPLSARVVAVADVFDALTSERVYKKAMCPLQAKSLIESESGSHFDPVIVDAFGECWEQFLAAATKAQKQGKEKNGPELRPASNIFSVPNPAGAAMAGAFSK
jgi:putative two-component system response regulator